MCGNFSYQLIYFHFYFTSTSPKLFHFLLEVSVKTSDLFFRFYIRMLAELGLSYLIYWGFKVNDSPSFAIAFSRLVSPICLKKTSEQPVKEYEGII